jgi:DNA-binding MurR/RpiR family transcriptional regulator
MTIYDVAAASGVSLPSVTRFCRVVGFAGFRELLQGVAQSLGRVDSKDFVSIEMQVADEGLQALAARIANRQIDALQTTVQTLDFDAIERAIAAIATAKRVTVIGHGSAYLSAQGIAVKLNWAGVPAVAATPDLFSNLMIAIDAEDVVIGVSHQGRTRDTIELVRLAASFGATTIAVSTVADSPLASVSQIEIAVLSPDLVRAGTFLIAANALMLVADVIAASVAERRFNGDPPNRERVVEWIETNLRIGPTYEVREQPKPGRIRANSRRVAESIGRDGEL